MEEKEDQWTKNNETHEKQIDGRFKPSYINN